MGAGGGHAEQHLGPPEVFPCSPRHVARVSHTKVVSHCGGSGATAGANILWD